MRAETRGDQRLRFDGYVVEPARSMQANEYPWPHEIRVALPASSANATTTYPVLWVTDNLLEAALSVLGDVEMIVVSVGPDPQADFGIGSAFHRRRAYDFYPIGDFYPAGPAGDYLRTRDADAHDGEPLRGGGADQFLEFLVDAVRPALASAYPMDPARHGLFGHSAAGWFVVNAMFTRPQAFAKYIAASPALDFCNGLIFEREKQYAQTHRDLNADLFLGVGEAEMTVNHMFGCLSSTARMVELLSLRAYESLRMTAKVFPGETHQTSVSLTLSWGIRSVWRER